MSKKFWKFRNQTAGSAELLLYGDIASEQSWWGDEATPKQFAEDLAGIPETDAITVRINSGGGDVFAAQAIGNLLEGREGVTARIDGLCASAATIVACHCGRVIAANDSTYMVHPVQMYCGYANETELQKYLEALGTVKESIIGLYAKKTGRDRDEVTAWMDGTSWFTAQQAMENGFVDELNDGAEDAEYENRGGVLFVNSVSMGAEFDKAPEFVRTRAERFANKTPAGGPDNNEEEQDMEIKTVDDLRKAYPELAGQIEQAAAQTERERIQGIEDASLPGSEALAEKAKFSEPMSVSDFAVALVRDAKKQGAAWLAQAGQDAQDSGANDVRSEPAAQKNDEFLDAIRSVRKQ